MDPRNIQPVYKHIELTYLNAAAAGNKAYVLKYIGIFIDNLPVHTAKLQSACIAKDHELLRAALHTLKAQLHFMGAVVVVSQMEELEAILRQTGEVNAEVKKDIDTILTAVKLTVEELEQIKMAYQ